MTISTKLVDATNFSSTLPEILDAMKTAPFVGLDTETEDSRRHEGLNAYCKYNEDGIKSKATKLVFDMRRTTMTGFSIYPEEHDTAFYINLNHADVENRVPWEQARVLLEQEVSWIAHNAAFELTVFKACHNFTLPNYICTLQMAVSAFGPDEYPIDAFLKAGQGGIARLIPDLIRNAHGYNPETRDMSPALSEIVYKILAKESDAEHSYNGFVKAITYGYGLKKLVQRFFNHKMTTFEEVLGGRAHMGQLTGTEVAAYGADDAYWAVRLFRHLLAYMAKNVPSAIPAFFDQENPMVREYSNIWLGGMRVNSEAIYERRDLERENMAEILRDMKTSVNDLLPFDAQLAKSLATEKWYAKNGERYRSQIAHWASLEDPEDSYGQCMQVRGPVSNAWSKEMGDPESSGPNFSHYIPMRTLMYDLIGAKVIRSQGKVQSDGEARGKVLDQLEDGPAMKVVQSLNGIAGVEQRMKLYLTPYTQLMDPETSTLYPVVSSELATRRMGASVPNPMQLVKRGESTYVRGFFQGDNDEHVIISCDWSGIELVEIGEMSGDPEFLKAFGQIPHEDLHSGAAADILSVDIPGLDEDNFKDLKKLDKLDDFREKYGVSIANYNRLFNNLKGQLFASTKDAYKYWRTEVGKGANFNYVYSGALATVGDRMGWSSDKMWQATDRYRARFSVMEQWRVGLIDEVQQHGRLILPDGHHRVRFEATPLWRDYFLSKFQIPGAHDDDILQRYNGIIEFIARKIQTRANNQSVNAMVQGTCATIAKRSVIRILQKARARGWGPDVFRFMVPIHDELLFSVDRSIAVEAVHLIRDTMIDHPDLFQKCKLDASPAIGLTFEPWHPKKAPKGQIEIFELPDIGLGNVGGRATDDQIKGVVDYLFDQQRIERLAA